ncbi:MAG: hypothetical protein ACQSGP_13700 [Frankia sp.]
MSPVNPADELRAARQAVEQAQSHVRTLRAQSGGSRVAGRLEVDVRRVVEDLDDLAAETGALGTGALGTGALGTGDRARGTAPGFGLRHRDVEPVPVPASRRDEPEFQPECDDEGVGGGWHADPPTNETSRRRRRAQVRGGPGFRGAGQTGAGQPRGENEIGDGR